MRSRLVPSAAILLALAAVTLAGPEDGKAIVLRTEDLGLRAVTGPTITPRRAKEILAECRRAFATIATELGVNSGHVFHLERRAPVWMPPVDLRDPRIWVRLEERFRVADMGAEAYLARMRTGVLRVHIPAPAGEIGPGHRHRIWREIAHAILAQTGWRALPLWLREGLAEALAGIGTEECHVLLTTLKQEIVEMGDEVPVPVILDTVDRDAWARASGRAVSWGLVRLLTEAQGKVPAMLYSQVRMLLAHLATYPDEISVIREHTHLVRDQLRDHGAGPDVLSRALAVWAKDGFPVGHGFRKSRASRMLRSLKAPRLFRVRIDARFGPTVNAHDPSGIFLHYKDLQGEAAWRFPWRTTLQAWLGVRGRPGTKPRFDPERAKDGYFLAYPSWSARREGRKTFPRRTIELPVATTKYGFAWLGVTSPNGVRYLYEFEKRLK